MRKALIDTNIYVAFKRNDKSIIEAFTRLDYIALDITVLAELYSGFKNGNYEKKNRVQLEQFINSPRVYLLNHDHNTAEFYSDIYLNLRKKGQPIPTNDIWIAAVAKQHGLALFSYDNHFNYIDGLLMMTDV